MTAVATSALNLAPSTETTPQHDVLQLNTSQPACVQLEGQANTPSIERAVATYAATR